jgi:excisionase family DNA binding protein
VTTPEQHKPQITSASEIDFSDVAFLTVAEVAEVLRLSKMTVYRMVHSGELPAVKVGRAFRVQARVVRDALKSHVVAAPAAEAEVAD